MVCLFLLNYSGIVLKKIEILKNINIDLAIGGGFNIVRVNKKEER